LLWRLRRATSIETGLFHIQNEIVQTHASTKQIQPRPKDRVVKALFRHRETTSAFQPIIRAVTAATIATPAKMKDSLALSRHLAHE
jgi:hypothetical protein